MLSVLVDSKNAGKRIAMRVACSRIQLTLVKSAIRSYITIHGVGFPTEFSGQPSSNTVFGMAVGSEFLHEYILNPG